MWIPTQVDSNISRLIFHSDSNLTYVNGSTGGPHYMRSFYLWFQVYAIQKWPFFWDLSSNLQLSLVFLYANLLYASLFLESLSLAYNEVHLYNSIFLFDFKWEGGLGSIL